ncbi:DUF3243 family protein [Candidatus Formimonas warabiya]|uniref:DUF3243 domain-containing protein n=1 Tax=Formimonas warabiya TaxID=1761012 RepID=A0A3G1KV62_FORW1|nr:DUF3243 family protein [Candidatus Formimonas warabiya]ATW26331.1 hypothetical protein DCMF_17570 [Candidatus Formimonas warabiya]
MHEILNKLDTSSWDNYKRSLGRGMEVAKELGMSEQEIASVAQKFGSYLSQNINPDLPENKALKELWQIADPHEQQTLTNLMMKIAKSS